MKTTKLLLFAVTAILAACTEKGGPEKTPAGNEGNISLIATTGALSRTELGEGNKINWKSGDAISVWEKDNVSNSNIEFGVIAASVGTATGKFSGTLTPAGTPFTLYSVYPYSSSYGSDPTAIALNIPDEVSQVTDINSVIGVSDFMVGRSDDTLYDGEAGAYKMQFHHPLAFVEFVIDGRDCIYREATLKSLTMTADVAFVGDVTLNCEDGTVTTADTGDGGKTLVINFPVSALMSSVQTAWVAINPVDLTDAHCQFALEMTNGQQVTFTVNPGAMSAEGLYKFEFSDIDAKIATKKGVPTYVSLLTKWGGARANCYIVNEGGYYRFAAQRVDKTNCFEGESPYSDGYRADWLWTSSEGKVTGVNIGNSGNINFRVEPGSECNTVIALRDPSSNIVWSWHIWCTPDDPMTPNHYSRNDAWLMANRNLGALSDTDPGLYYQWGRKDPFPADKNSCVVNTGVSITQLASSNGAVTPDAIGYSVSHPSTILTENTYRTWISTASQADAAQSLWNNTNTKANKTNYDPCPPGYCVPVSNGYAWYTYFVDASMIWQAGGVTYTDPASVATFYPAGGYLSGLTLSNSGETVRCWAANLTAAPSSSSNMFGTSLLLTLSTHSIKTNEGSRAAFGLNVRCMKI